MLGLILEDSYEVIYAENGREALDLMRQHAGELSIVLLDLLMPEMNGFEVMEYVKRDEQLRRIPIIVLTAEKSAELQALQMGAADFITKPFDVTEFILARVGRNIETSKTDRRLVSLILDIAKYLEVAVVAEGVETEGQLNILREGKCDVVQGYYFSRPLPAEEFEALIRREIQTERN